MRRPRTLALLSLALVVIAVPFLTACGATQTPAPTTAPTRPATSAATAAATTAATQAPAKTATPAPTATATAPAPTVGGVLTIAGVTEPDTLDVQKGTTSATSSVLGWTGACLVIRDLAGKYVPYLAASWTVSADGLAWDFALRKDVKFHDGTPLTADDYAWTFQRALNPATAAALTKSLLGPVVSVEARDKYTLRFNLSSPYFPMLYNLANAAWMQPLSKAWVEKMGDKVARQTMGTGPYIFKEWQLGQKIVLERNPDFSWGPSFMLNQGPFYMQTVEFRFIGEYATIMAGLEADELGYVAGVETKDIQRVKNTGRFQVIEGLQQGLAPFLALNLTRPPFDDLRVRKAMSLAVDRQSMIKAVLLGNGVEQKGPLAACQVGYWPEVEKLGYGYDLAQAKALMKEAGYTTDATGMLQKDGKPFKVSMHCMSTDSYVKPAEVLKEQYKALGIEVTIELKETALVIKDMLAGQYEIGLMGFFSGEADSMYLLFHSSQIGASNHSQLKDPEFDKILEATRNTVDPDKRQDYVNQAQQYVIDNAIVVLLYTPRNYRALSNRIQGIKFSVISNALYFNDAYIVSK